MEKFKPNKNTMYYAWGSADGRVAKHLAIMTWNVTTKSFHTYKIWVKKGDYENTKACIFMTWQGQSKTEKNLVEANYMDLWKHY